MFVGITGDKKRKQNIIQFSVGVANVRSFQIGSPALILCVQF